VPDGATDPLDGTTEPLEAPVELPPEVWPLAPPEFEAPDIFGVLPELALSGLLAHALRTVPARARPKIEKRRFIGFR
jgi:hypothetical protein